MKNLFLLSVCLFSISTLSAQTFGIRGGVSSLNIKAQEDGDAVFDNQSFLLGFQGGVQVDIPVNDNFAIETGLFLASKGLTTSEEGDILGTPFIIDFTVNMLALNIPILARYGGALGDNKIYGAAGPFLGYNLSGTIVTRIESGGDVEEDEEELSIGSDQADDIKPLDFGLTIGGGIILANNIQIGLAFDLGLANLLIEPEDGDVFSTRALNLFVTYTFNNE